MPCPTASHCLSLPRVIKLCGNFTGSVVSPTQHCSVWHLPCPSPDLSTDPAMEHGEPLLGTAGPNLRHWGCRWGLFLVSFPLLTSFHGNKTHRLASYQNAGAAPGMCAAPDMSKPLFLTTSLGSAAVLLCFSLPGSQLGVC